MEYNFIDQFLFLSCKLFFNSFRSHLFTSQLNRSLVEANPEELREPNRGVAGAHADLGSDVLESDLDHETFKASCKELLVKRVNLANTTGNVLLPVEVAFVIFKATADSSTYVVLFLLVGHSTGNEE